MKQRTAKVEVPILDKSCVWLAGSADGVGSKPMAAAVLATIGRSVAGTKDHRARRVITGEAVRQIQEVGLDRHCTSMYRDILRSMGSRKLSRRTAQVSGFFFALSSECLADECSPSVSDAVVAVKSPHYECPLRSPLSGHPCEVFPGPNCISPFPTDQFSFGVS